MELFKEWLTNPYYSSIIVFITQICLLYLRTINVVYTTELNIIGAMWSNSLFAIAWLLSTSIGLKALLDSNILPLIAFLVGGSFGTYLGLINEVKKDKKSKKNKDI